MTALLAATGMAAVAALLNSWVNIRFWRAWLPPAIWRSGLAVTVLLATLGSIAIIITVAGGERALVSDTLPAWTLLIPVGIASGLAGPSQWGDTSPAWLRVALLVLNLTTLRIEGITRTVCNDALLVIRAEVVWRCDEVPPSRRDKALCCIARASGAETRADSVREEIEKECTALLGWGRHKEQARDRLVAMTVSSIVDYRITRIPVPVDWKHTTDSEWTVDLPR